MSRFWHRVGHRGAPHRLPGNTLQGFRLAVESGCSMVECDIRQAADGILVLAHDREVRDHQGKTYVIAETDSATLHSLNLGAGEGVPGLEELVSWANGRCSIMADMKCEGGEIEARVVAALAPLAQDAKVVPGANADSRRRFRELDPTLPLALTLSRADEAQLADSFEAFVTGVDTSAVTWEHPLLTLERITTLHEHGIHVFGWTVDDLATMQRLIEAGVDGIISNRVDLLAALCSS